MATKQQREGHKAPAAVESKATEETEMTEETEAAEGPRCKIDGVKKKGGTEI